MQPKRRWNAVILAAALTWTTSLVADDAAEELKLLRQQIEALSRKVEALEQTRAKEETQKEVIEQKQEALDQQVKVIERKRELEQEAATEKAKTTPVVSVGATGLQVRSADSNFVFGLRGYFQGDGRFAVGGSAAPFTDTFLMRRVRPIFEGSLYKFIDYRVMLDFASAISSSSSAANNAFLQDAYANIRFLPELQLQLGKMKEPVGLERLQSGANLLFIERGYPTLLVPNRNVGALLQGDLLGQRLTYQAGVFNGVAGGGSTDNQSADGGNVAARLFGHPFRGSGIEPLEGLGLGVAGTLGDFNGNLRGYLSPSQQSIFSYYVGTGTNANVTANGQQWKLTPQGYYYYGPFGLFAEYVVASQSVAQNGGVFKGASTDIVNHAWQVAASWFVTGEKNAWKTVTPKEPVTLRSGGGWGALELAARIQGLDLDNDIFPVYADPTRSVSSAFSWGLGVNWYLNRNLKFSLNYENTDFEGGRRNPLTAQNEQLILTQVQVSF